MRRWFQPNASRRTQPRAIFGGRKNAAMLEEVFYWRKRIAIPMVCSRSIGKGRHFTIFENIDKHQRQLS
jgi:hypothetical protein